MLLLYHLSILIGTILIYMASHCVYIIFLNDLIVYFDQIVSVISQSCLASFVPFSLLEIFMPHCARDPLYILCERIILPSRPNECFPYGHSKCARFYWGRKINHNIYYWNNFNYSYDNVFLCPKSPLMENKLCL